MGGILQELGLLGRGLMSKSGNVPRLLAREADTGLARRFVPPPAAPAAPSGVRAYRAMSNKGIRPNKSTGMIHAALDPEVARNFATKGREVKEVNILAKNPFDFRDSKQVSDLADELTTPENLALFNKQTKEIMGPHYDHEADARYLRAGLEDGAYQTYEIPVVIDAIRRRGHDAIYMVEEGEQFRPPNIAVFDPSLIEIVKKYGIAGVLGAGLITEEMADQMRAQGVPDSTSRKTSPAGPSAMPDPQRFGG